MTVIQDLAERERRFGRGARTGLMWLSLWLLEIGRTDDDVTGLRVHRRIVRRRSGETLAELEERANPRGSYRAFPMPQLRDQDQALSDADWQAAIELDQVIREVAHEARAR